MKNSYDLQNLQEAKLNKYSKARFLSPKMSDAEDLQIAEGIANICRLTGFSGAFTAEGVKTVVDFLKINFGSMTTGELQQAFNCAICGEFDAQVDHYNQMSAKYISQVLRAYKSFLSRNQNFIQTVEIEEKKEVSKEDIIKAVSIEVRYILDQYEGREESKLLQNQFAIITMRIKTLEKLGFTVAENDKKRKVFGEVRNAEILNKGSYWVKKNKNAWNEFKNKDFLGKTKAAMIRNEVYGAVARKCKERILKDFYQDCKEIGFNLSEEIPAAFSVWRSEFMEDKE